ncbi:MAG: hypothetical protein PWR20_266 [Bacteroidales bacterium]|jgi:hypothetical protein|nr:hypothetical protein [Bacteroidales bacterium]MDN5328372.1 hypothetical protein [Bacteroidales bacterium]
MLSVSFKGNKDEILSNCIQFIAKEVPLAMHELEVFEFINSEIINHLEGNNLMLRSIELEINNYQVLVRFILADASITVEKAKHSIITFLKESGLKWLLNDFYFSEENNFVIKYSFTYVNESLSARRFYFLQEYWKKSLKTISHD